LPLEVEVVLVDVPGRVQLDYLPLLLRGMVGGVIDGGVGIFLRLLINGLVEAGLVESDVLDAGHHLELLPHDEVVVDEHLVLVVDAPEEREQEVQQPILPVDQLHMLP